MTPDSPLMVLGDVELVAEDSPFPGVARVSYRSSRATMASYVFAPDASFPLHTHPEQQITVIIEGEVELTAADAVHRVRAGETFVIEGGVTHGVRAGGTGARFLAIVCPPRSRADDYAIAVQQRP